MLSIVFYFSYFNFVSEIKTYSIMKKFILPIITALFFTSCVTVFYPAPQPEFAKELTEIPEKFQGTFEVVGNDIIYKVTQNTIFIDGDTIEENLVFKSWGDYFFWNLKEDSTSNYWTCFIIHTNGLKGEKEKLTLQIIPTEDVNWTYFNLKENEEGIRDIYINKLSTLQFLYLLRMSQSHDENFEIHRIK